jgi:hypothetical protein
MAIEYITDVVPLEKSTMVVNCRIKDASGNWITPNTMGWTHTDRNGVNISGRTYPVSVTPSGTPRIVLSNTDLALTATEQSSGEELFERHLLIEWTYNAAEGMGLPGKKIIVYNIRNLQAVS